MIHASGEYSRGKRPAGAVAVYVQNDRPGAQGIAPGEQLMLGWSPDCTFVVDAQEAS